MSEREPEQVAAPWADETRAYNERLFGAGLRGWLHGVRFRWVAAQYRRRCSEAPSVIELGCYDGKILELLSPAPRRYLGLDANWEGGLDLGEQRWGHLDWVEFRACETPDQLPADERFDLAISMETLEHLTDDVLEGYVERLAGMTDRLFFVTVPNEIGPICMVKQVLKKLLLGGSQFTWRDIGNATLGRTHRIPRDQHRGFNHRLLIDKLRRYFDVVAVRGLQAPFLPAYLNITIGIVLTPRRPS